LTGRNDGVVMGDGVTLGDRVITPGHAPAARFDVELDEDRDRRVFGSVWLGRSPIVPIPNLSSVRVMVTFQPRSAGDLNFRVLAGQSDGNAQSNAWVATVDKDGRFAFSR